VKLIENETVKFDGKLNSFFISRSVLQFQPFFLTECKNRIREGKNAENFGFNFTNYL
jgi:hypothetical protein